MDIIDTLNDFEISILNVLNNKPDKWFTTMEIAYYLREHPRLNKIYHKYDKLSFEYFNKYGKCVYNTCRLFPYNSGKNTRKITINRIYSLEQVINGEPTTIINNNINDKEQIQSSKDYESLLYGDDEQNNEQYNSHFVDEEEHTLRQEISKLCDKIISKVAQNANKLVSKNLVIKMNSHKFNKYKINHSIST